MHTSSRLHPETFPHETRWVLLLLTLALFARIYGSLYYTYDLEPDFAINSLMVQHAAAGRHFPTMYYNESYVGTPEVYVGALFQRMLPMAVTPSLLGFGLVSFLALPFFYLWARKIAGPLAALAGLGLLVIGPKEFMYRNVFIGYPTALLCGMAACWLTLRIRESATCGAPPAWALFCLGLVAGIGWWTQAIVLAYLMPCLIVLLGSVSWRHWIRSGLIAVPGLLLGALPWLVFTFREASALHFVTNVSSAGDGTFFRSLRTAVQMLGSMYPLHATSAFGSAFGSVLGWAASLGLGILVAGGLVALLQARGERMERLMPWLLIVSTLLLCGLSRRFAHIPATRYVLPVVPGIALIAGQGVAWLTRLRLPVLKPLGLLCLLPVLLTEFLRLPNLWDSRYQANRERRLQQIERLLALSESESIDIFYGDFFMNWITSHSREQLRVCAFPYRFDRYRPYRGAAVLTTNLGVLRNYQGLDLFLEQTGGAADRMQVRGIGVQWNIRKKSAASEWVALEAIQSVVWENGDPAWDLFDGNLDTPLSIGHLERGKVETTGRTLIIRFHEPQRITGVHAWGPSGTWGRVNRMDALVGGDEMPLLESGRSAGWFWSGDMPYLLGFLAHFQAYFPEVTAREVYISVFASESDGKSHVSELRLLTPARKGHDDTVLHAPADVVTVLADTLKQDPPTKVYAPRWIAERLRVELPGVPNVLPDDLYAQYEGRDRYPAHPLVRMDTVDGAALVVSAMASGHTREHLRNQGWDTRIEAEVGPWVLLRVGDRIAGEREGEGSKWLHWTEQGVFLATNWSEWFAETSSRDAGVPLLREAVSFPRGIVLETLAIDDREPQPGATVRMMYEWVCPTGTYPGHYAVFVHVRKDGQTVFQDDHVWMSEIPSEALTHQPEGWAFQVTRELKIPDALAPGTYSISLGLYERNTGDRLRPRKSEHVHRRAVVLDDAIRIVGPE